MSGVREMNIDIFFYTRHDFGGWRRYTWLPVQWAQGKFVHCEIFAHSRILNANNSKGVVWDGVGPFKPSGVKRIPIDSDDFDVCVENVIGESYSWTGFFSLLMPRWGSDPRGMICSELVAYILANSAAYHELRIPFVAVPPHRWTPQQIFDCIENIGNKYNIELEPTK